MFRKSIRCISILALPLLLSGCGGAEFLLLGGIAATSTSKAISDAITEPINTTVSSAIACTFEGTMAALTPGVYLNIKTADLEKITTEIKNNNISTFDDFETRISAPTKAQLNAWFDAGYKLITIKSHANKQDYYEALVKGLIWATTKSREIKNITFYKSIPYEENGKKSIDYASVHLTITDSVADPAVHTAYGTCNPENSDTKK